MVIQNGNLRKTMLIMTLVMLAVATFTLIIYIVTKNKPNGYLESVGTIDHIESSIEAGELKYHYFVKYIFLGKEYINELHNYSGSFSVGQEIQILINITDPTQIQNLGTVEGNKNLLIATFTIFGVSAVFGGLTAFSFLYKRKNNKRS